MHCDDVIKELAAPSDDRDATALTEHLTRCLSCATWAERASLLDRLWETTRPAEPDQGSWNKVWDNIAQSLDESMSKDVRSLTSPREHRAESAREVTPRSIQARLLTPAGRRALGAVGLVGLAQAAAVLLAVGLGWRTHIPSRPPQTTQNVSSTHFDLVAVRFREPIRIEEGHVVLIRAKQEPDKMLVPLFLPDFTMVPVCAEGPAIQVVDRTPEGMSFGIDDWYVMFNAVEWIANPVVAMKE
jgi:hypothetical protein